MSSQEFPLIPRKLLFGNPDKASPRISPDGSQLAYLAPVDGVLNARPVTRDNLRVIRFFVWAYTNRHILYLQDKGGDENWRVYSVNLENGGIKDLTPLEGVQAQIDSASHKFPLEILVSLNDRIPQYHDTYRIHIETGERVLVQKNEDGFAGFLADDEYRIHLGFRMTPDGGAMLLKKSDVGWEPFLTIPMEDSLTTTPIGFNKDATALYLADSRGRDTSTMTLLDITTGRQTLLAEDPLSDVNDHMIHPTEKTLQAVAFMYERKHWDVVDPAVAADLAFLRTVADGEVEVISRTLDDNVWIVAYLMDNGPIRYYRYERSTQKVHFLFTNRKALEGQTLVNMHPVVIPSRDGLKLVSYYSLPPTCQGKTHPDRPLPMVLFVHGGPWARDVWGYNSYHQLMANRGYVVLSELPRFHQLRQELCQCRQPAMGRKNAR